MACVAGVCIPQADGIVRTPTGEGGAIGTEDDAGDTARMPDEGLVCFAGCDIPQPDGAVPTPASEGGAIGTEDDALDNVRMPGEGGEPFAGVCIPQVDFFPTPTGEGGAIRTEDNAAAGMPGEDVAYVAGVCIPQADGTVPTSTSEGGAIGTEDNTRDKVRMPGEQYHFLVGGGIVEPNPDGSCNGEQGAIGRIRHLVDAAFAEAAGCAFG